MQQWARLMTQALPRESQDTSTRLFELGKSYLNMGETFWRLCSRVRISPEASSTGRRP
jgi:hypothetical protein